jgi:hypothetical protein
VIAFNQAGDQGEFPAFPLNAATLFFRGTIYLAVQISFPSPTFAHIGINPIDDSKSVAITRSIFAQIGKNPISDLALFELDDRSSGPAATRPAVAVIFDVRKAF